MKTIVVGGVPEHFNLPWHLLLSETGTGIADLRLSWRDFADGSGAMVRALNAGEIDVAVLLTEAATAGKLTSAAFEIVSHYVESPLVWGLHVPAAGPLKSEADLRGKRYAISRFGSGSHLMAFAHAQSQGWSVGDLQFVEVATLQGAVDAFEAGHAEVFFWERFMTKPLVDAGKFRRVAEFVAPWPAFVICVRTEILAALESGIRTLIENVQESAARFRARPDAARMIAERYTLRLEDVEQWLQLTRWSTRCDVDRAALARAQAVLTELDATRLLTSGRS